MSHLLKKSQPKIERIVSMPQPEIAPKIEKKPPKKSIFNMPTNAVVDEIIKFLDEKQVKNAQEKKILKSLQTSGNNANYISNVIRTLIDIFKEMVG